MSATMTYTILTGDRSTEGSIKNWVNSALAPAATILAEAEQDIYTALRVREMLVLSEGTLNTGDYRILLPNNFRATHSFRIVGTKAATLTKKTIGQLEAAYTYKSDSTRQDGKPQHYAEDANYIWFDVLANEAYSYEWRTYESLAPLAEATNENNFLTDKYPSLLRYACLAKAFEWRRNAKERATYLALMRDMIDQVNDRGDFELIDADLVMEVG